ncbi:MAG: hypothetical protein JWL61_3197 [Gemmatimonadetes bacterium]|nr:hypothetical protein [Gemmatimonadota bacterium]
MTIDAKTLWTLLPAVHRARDAERGGALKALVAVLAEQLDVLDENIEQLYDDQFIETCAPWVIPYIGDLIGYRPLHGGSGSPRAEVAHTIALRRRKGTAAVLEQLARDVTGWNARAVEEFQLLGTTQHMHHVRPAHAYAPDLRHWDPLESIGSAFDGTMHTVDVRRIASGRGRFNIPNVAIFLFPIEAHRSTRSPAIQVDARRWRVSPLGHDMPLYSRPVAEDSITHLAEPLNVPRRISRRILDRDVRSATPAYYGEGKSVVVYLNGDVTPVPVSDVRVCDLSDDAGTWAHLPDDDIAIDPVLGRIALPAAPSVPITSVEVTYHWGFSADLGGGEYERESTFGALPGQIVLRVPDDHTTIQSALSALAGDGVVEVTDSGRYDETLAVQVSAGRRIELRCANEHHASLVLGGPFTIAGGAESEFELNGFLVSGDSLRVPATPGNELARLRLIHTTLVPGLSHAADGGAVSPAAPSLIVEIPGVDVTLSRTIVGGMRAHPRAKIEGTDVFIDATDVAGIALAAPDGVSAGASLELRGATVVGKIHAELMPLVSNSLLLAELAPADSWTVPVRVVQRQTGCVRFTWLPSSSRVPQRYHCLPDASGSPAPRMLSLRYGTPTYGRLSPLADDAIRHGADDDGEMGALNHLLASQREANLRVRLAEFLRAGLEVGLLFAI